MSIEKSQYQSTVDLAYPDEDANLLGQDIEKFSTKSWLMEHRKPLAVCAFMFAVFGGFALGSITSGSKDFDPFCDAFPTHPACPWGKVGEPYSF
jgi:hypothetical protein